MRDKRLWPASTGWLIAFTAFAVSIAPLRAAEIRGDMGNGVVFEGKIEAGDYTRLSSVYFEKRSNQFYVGAPLANEIYLASPGGDLAEAIKIGHLVRMLKLHTVVPSGEYPRGPYAKYSDADRHRLINPKANYMCASACFFIFVAGTERTLDMDFADPRLGIHRPYMSDSDLRTLSGDQAIALANQLRATVENYLKEMNVPAKYFDLMFSVPKDKVRWLSNADVADLEGTIPELRDWLAARCDKRTDLEKAIWEKLKTRLVGSGSAAEQSIMDKTGKKMLEMHRCEDDALDKLSGRAWVRMFDPTCAAMAPEARSLAEDHGLCSPEN